LKYWSWRQAPSLRMKLARMNGNTLARCIGRGSAQRVAIISMCIFINARSNYLALHHLHCDALKAIPKTTPPSGRSDTHRRRLPQPSWIALMLNSRTAQYLSNLARINGRNQTSLDSC
jgi:hypothetical protein